MNYQAIDKGAEGLVEVKVKSAWKNLPVEEVTVDENRPHFVKTIADPVNQVKGYDLPVSAFTGYEDGTMPNGSAAYENVVQQISYQCGFLIIVFNVINVLLFVRMQ